MKKACLEGLKKTLQLPPRGRLPSNRVEVWEFALHAKRAKHIHELHEQPIEYPFRTSTHLVPLYIAGGGR